LNLLSATTGSAEVLGRDSRTIRGKAYAEIGYVSENQEIPEWMKVGALLEYLRDFYPTWDSSLEQSLVKQFDLPLNRKIKALSRGMKMKLALASALAFHPRLIVLDEPFGGLDPLVRDQLIESLLERASESTVFISSHDLAEIESFASHVRLCAGLKTAEEVFQFIGGIESRLLQVAAIVLVALMGMAYFLACINLPQWEDKFPM
jgi:ABC-2 type transport system ATP-binding protein